MKVAFVVYKSDGLAEDRFVLHSFSSLQNNQLALLPPLFTSVIPDFESLVFCAVPANPDILVRFL